MPRKTKKQLEIEKLKEEYFNQSDKLENILVYNRTEELIYEYKFIPSRSRVFKCYYQNEKDETVSRDVYEKINGEKNIIAIEVEGNEGAFLEALEYSRKGEDTGKLIVKFEEQKINDE